VLCGASCVVVRAAWVLDHLLYPNAVRVQHAHKGKHPKPKNSVAWSTRIGNKSCCYPPPCGFSHLVRQEERASKAPRFELLQPSLHLSSRAATPSDESSSQRVVGNNDGRGGQWHERRHGHAHVEGISPDAVQLRGRDTKETGGLTWGGGVRYGVTSKASHGTHSFKNLAPTNLKQGEDVELEDAEGGEEAGVPCGVADDVNLLHGQTLFSGAPQTEGRLRKATPMPPLRTTARDLIQSS
jgi:hypothetical protein